MHTAIVTDSTADIPAALAEKLNIHVVPTILMLGTESFEDGKGLSRREFYERLPDRNPLPTTGTPAAGTFENLYQRLFDQGVQQIISIHVASALSGVYNTAKLAAKNFGPSIALVDSESLSMGIGFQVIAAAEAAAAHLPPKEIIQSIRQTRAKTQVIAMLDTLEYVHRSGRVGWTRARIGALLRIKPFVAVNAGQVFNLGQVRTRNKGLRHLQHLLLEQGPLERLALLHTNAEAEARALLADLGPEMPPHPPIINVTTVIGTHVGPNGLGFAAVRK